ncbi:MAG: tetratricopeptide repeat protein [Phycisphaerae bacterium]
MTPAPYSTSEQVRPPALSASLLIMAGIVLATLSVIYGGLIITQSARIGSVSGVLLGCLTMAGGLGGCGLLCGLAWLITRPVFWKRLAPPVGPANPPPDGEEDADHSQLHWPVMTATLQHEHQAILNLSERIEQLMTRIDEIESTVMLSPEELQQRRTQRQSERIEQYRSQIREAMEQQDFAQARHVLDELAREEPGGGEVESLLAELEEARNQAEGEQFSNAVQRVEDLMAVSRFEQALEAARRLRDAHPDAKGAQALVDRVQREHDAYRDERRSRLYGQVEKLVTARRWGKAVQAAEEFLEAYPDAPEAELVGVQMDTLRENARIEEVRAYRDRIRDYIERRRFSEAIELAREVIRDHPDTAAAQELRQQLPRLKQLAADKI